MDLLNNINKYKDPAEKNKFFSAKSINIFVLPFRANFLHYMELLELDCHKLSYLESDPKQNLDKCVEKKCIFKLF